MSILSEFIDDMATELRQTQTPESAWKVVQEYLRFFSAEGAGKDLQAMAIAGLTNKKIKRYKNADSRFNMLFFYEYTTLFIKAVDIIAKEKQQQTNQP